jgi:hypothetical protein
MLFIMGLLYVRTMRQRGYDLISVSPATHWVQKLEGDYLLIEPDADSVEPEVSGGVRVWQLPDSLVKIDARFILAFQTTGHENDGHPGLQGVLGISDFEDRQILVEWYERDGRTHQNKGLIRQDGCEFLLENDTLGFWGTTLGEFCFPFEGTEFYAQLKVMGTPDLVTIRLERYASFNDSLLETNIYRLIKEP